MPTMEQRIAALEAELAALKAPKSPPALRVVEEGAKVLIGPDAIGAPRLVLPTDEEYAKLRQIVDRHYPNLSFQPHSTRWAENDAADDAAGFKTSFAYLATLERLDELPRADRYPSWWLSGAEEWARSTGIPLRSFIAAVAAHGDILFSGLDKYAALGLRQNGGDCGRRYGEVWKEVLRTGEILKPVKSGELARA